MAEEQDTGAQAALPEGEQQPTGQAGQPPTEEAGGEKEPFDEKQKQYLGSWLGRIVQKQLNDVIVPLLQQAVQERQQQPASPIPSAATDDAMKAFNEKLQEKIFAGNVVEAVRDVMEFQGRVKQNITQAQKVETARMMTAYLDKPYYKDIAEDMGKIAQIKVGQGWPAQAAVEHAYTEAKARYLEDKMAGGSGDRNLGMLSGGRPTPRQKTLVLPPNLKAAAQRDIGAGLFKDEKEWVAAMDPGIREKYGL